MKKSTRGFTLIELLVVIAIIGLLASIVLVSLNSSRKKARDAKRMGDLQQIENALELYIDSNLVYPGSSTTFWWISDNNFPGALGYPPCATSGGLAPYLPNVCATKDSQGYPYAYTKKTDGNYKLGARFELSQNQGTAFTYGSETTVADYYEQKQ